MCSLIDLCFLCTKDFNCVSVNDKIVSQVKYLLPEITIIKLGIPLRICSVCDGALYAFSKFKQSSVESSRRLETSIKGAQGPPLHTGSPPVVDDNETPGAKPEKMEEIFIKEEFMEEIPLDTEMHTNRAFLNPIDFSETISAEPHNHDYEELHKDRVSQNIQMYTDKNFVNRKEISIKEEQIEEIPVDREFYNNILKKECVSHLINEDTDRQPEHNTEDESAIFNTGEEVWEESYTVSEEKTVEIVANSSKDISIESKKITQKTKNQNQFKKKIQKKKELRCSICEKSFTLKATLNSHMKIHTGVKDFQCEICEKLFKHKATLIYHMTTHSGMKDFQCEICEKSFTRKGHLTDHIKIHSGVKEFKCKVCEKSFRQNSHLTRHMKFHSSVKDFHCEICEKSFTRKTNLISHMKNHSSESSF